MRVLMFTILIVLFLLFPWWVGMGCALLYAYRFHAYELIPLGIFLDALFAPAYDPSSLLYITGLLAITITLEYVKPFLSFYEETA